MAMHVKPHIVVHINPIGAMDRNAAPVGTTATMRNKRMNIQKLI
jgi:hypothetical protein